MGYLISPLRGCISPSGSVSSWGRLSSLPIRAVPAPLRGWGMLMHRTGGSEASAPATALRPVGAKISLINLTHGVPSIGGQGRGLSYFAPTGLHPHHLICVHLWFHSHRRVPRSTVLGWPIPGVPDADAHIRGCRPAILRYCLRMMKLSMPYPDPALLPPNPQIRYVRELRHPKNISLTAESAAFLRRSLRSSLA